jgi:broad specificity phosphatase PhoE
MTQQIDTALTEAGPASDARPASAVPDGRIVVLVRHGETEWARDGKHTGRTDVSLTPRGEEQARALRGALATLLRSRPALVLTSPLRRAADTARLAGLDAIEDEDLVELDYGAYEGLTTPEIRRDAPGWTVWTAAMPGGEALTDAAVRVDRAITRVRGADGPVVVVAHGHLLRLLTARWLGLEPSAGAHFVLGTAGIGVLGYEHSVPALRRWNLP